MKLYGEGEGKVRPPGVGQRRTWRQVQVVVEAEAKDLLEVEVTTLAWPESEVFAGRREAVEGEIAPVDGAGADDSRGVDDGALERGATVAVPPRANAVPWADPPPRTHAVASLAEQGVAEGRENSGWLSPSPSR